MRSIKGTDPKAGFAVDVQAIRKRARAHISDGAVTTAYKGRRATIVGLLNASLATEIVCVLRYKRHHFMSSTLGGIAGYAVTAELGVHATEEQEHADLLAGRIVQLGGEPDFDPAGLTTRSHAQYVAGATLVEMLEEDLIAERIAIDTYGEIIRYIGDDDPTTRRLFETILAQEEEHADEINDFLRRERGANGMTRPVLLARPLDRRPRGGGPGHGHRSAS
jgi:bacterioferritin